MKTLRTAMPAAVMAVALVLLGTRSIRVSIACALTLLLLSFALARPRQCVALLFGGGALLLDFSPLPVYRYFLLSDLLLLAACALQMQIDRRIVLYVPALFILLCLGYLAALLAAFGAAQDYSGVWNWLHFAFLMLVLVPLLTTLFVRRPDLARILVGAIVVSVLLQAFILFGQIANGLEWRTGTRILGALGTAGLWSYVAAIAALTGIATRARWSTRGLAFVALGVIMLAEVFLRSRMLWLSSLLGASLMFGLHSGRLLRGLMLAGGVAVVIVVGYLGGWYPDAIQRRISDTLRPTETSDLVARLQVVRELAGAIEHSAGTGIGVGQSETYLLNRHSTAQVVSVHNVVMHAAVEGGVVAATCIILLPLAILVLWRQAARAVRTPVDSFLLNWEVSTLLAVYAGAQLTPTLYEHIFYVILSALAAGAWADSQTQNVSPSRDVMSRIGGLRPAAEAS